MTILPTWTEIRVLVPLGWQELVGETLAPDDHSGIAFGASSLVDDPVPAGSELVRAYLAEDRDTPAARAEISARIAALGAATGAPELRGLVPSFRRLPPEDWATSWQKFWKPFRVGRLCLMRPGAPTPPRPNDVRFVLEPGGVFGSGRHATTRLCLALLQERLRPGQRVLDAGTGTGILAVAAALLGAESALGFDLDPGSAPYASSLAAENDVADRCTFRHGDFTALGEADRVFDGCLANIYTDIIRAHAADLRDRLAPGGWFVFSGIPAQREGETVAAIRAAGLKLETRLTRGRWRAFAGVRER